MVAGSEVDCPEPSALAASRISARLISKAFVMNLRSKSLLSNFFVSSSSLLSSTFSSNFSVSFSTLSGVFSLSSGVDPVLNWKSEAISDNRDIQYPRDLQFNNTQSQVQCRSMSPQFDKMNPHGLLKPLLFRRV